MNLKEKLIKLRKDTALTQEELADKLYVSRQTISNWENGKFYPDIETLILISDTFNVSLDYLLKNDIHIVKDIDKKIKSHKKLKVIIVTLLIVFISSLYIGYHYHNSHRKIIKRIYTLSVPENYTILSLDISKITDDNIDQYMNKLINIYIDDHDIDKANNLPIATNARIFNFSYPTISIMVRDNDYILLKEYEAKSYNFKFEMIKQK